VTGTPSPCRWSRPRSASWRRLGCACSRRCRAPTLLLFALLGLVSLSANPVLISLAVRFGSAAPTLASALATSIFNVGTAAGNWITGLALAGRLGTLAPPVVGVVSGALVLVPVVLLALLDRRARVERADAADAEAPTSAASGVTAG
jgi:DHA1 family inner membrane transport protein